MMRKLSTVFTKIRSGEGPLCMRLINAHIRGDITIGECKAAKNHIQRLLGGSNMFVQDWLARKSPKFKKLYENAPYEQCIPFMHEYRKLWLENIISTLKKENK